MDTNTILLQSAANAAQMAQEGQLRNTVVISFFGLVSLMVTTLGAVLLARIGANTKATAESTKETSGKTNTLLEKTEQIHTLTNSNLTKVTNALEVMSAKNAENDKMISSLNQRIIEYEKNQRIIEHEKHQVAPVKEEVKAAVKEAVIESVKTPVKEAVQESVFTEAQVSQLLRALGHRNRGIE